MKEFVPSSWLLKLRKILSAESENDEVQELALSHYRSMSAIGAEVGKAHLQSVIYAAMVSAI